ncbi:TlpA family protein disulfide reductase [Nocardioides furvisabuli]|uniref:TlpA family protein disulfide reductase n=1 Tax=Nocardioides furvisabuli TaxID=375542 RepID=UPI001E598DF6|nr:redoxin family protein [Nocardioides furvisabuli]
MRRRPGHDGHLVDHVLALRRAFRGPLRRRLRGAVRRARGRRRGDGRHPGAPRLHRHDRGRRLLRRREPGRLATVLWFWAPWCPTCRSQIPQVQDLAQTYGDRVGVVGIGSLDSAEAIADFAGDADGVTHLEDVDGELWTRFGVAEQSSFVVLDAAGEVVFEAGYGGSDDLGARVDALLG